MQETKASLEEESARAAQAAQEHLAQRQVEEAGYGPEEAVTQAQGGGAHTHRGRQSQRNGPEQPGDEE